MATLAAMAALTALTAGATAKQARNAPPVEATAPREAGEPIMAIVSIKRDRKSTRLNSSHLTASRMPSSA